MGYAQTLRRAHSPDARPDGTILHALPRRRHYLLECKVASPLDSTGRPTSPSSMLAACGCTAPALLDGIATKYARANAQGHIVVPLIHEVFGAMAPVTVKFLHKVAERTRGRQLAEHDDPLAPWSAPTLAPYLSQSVSIALQRSVSDQVLKRAADARAAPFRA